MESILAQRQVAQICEVIVVGEDVHGVIPKHSLVSLLNHVGPGPACHAYNEGIARSSGYRIAIFDGDVVLGADWLARVEERHSAGWEVVSGGVVIPQNPYWAHAYNWTMLHEYHSGLPGGARRRLPTMNLSVDRRVIDAVGPVPEDKPRMYDLEWTAKMSEAGFGLYFEPAARVRHYPCGITPGLLWRTWYAGGSCSQAVRRAHPASWGASRLLDQPALLLALSPLLAAAASARVLAAQPGNLRLWGAMPAVWLAKLAWCLGASAGRRRGSMRVSDYAYRPGEASERPVENSGGAQ